MIIPERSAKKAYLNYTVDEATGCYISNYSVASHGYAQIGWQNLDERRGTTAHRAAWVHVNGQIPDGMTIDHTCKNRRCVNVEHLRMLSNFDNSRRTSGRDWPLGECVNGHSDSELVKTPRGKVECRLCRRVWRRAHKERGLVDESTCDVNGCSNRSGHSYSGRRGLCQTHARMGRDYAITPGRGRPRKGANN